jgi:hypothetical protein
MLHSRIVCVKPRLGAFPRRSVASNWPDVREGGKEERRKGGKAGRRTGGQADGREGGKADGREGAVGGKARWAADYQEML